MTDKETLSETMIKDDIKKQKILDIIDHQFDLEIYLKHRELATIRKEIENAESTLKDLELAIKNESLAAMLPDLPRFTRQSAAALYYGQMPGGSSTINSNTIPSGSSKRKVQRSNQYPVLYGRRMDGVYVRLSCPVCHRENFTNQIGFQNHCRISHSLEFNYYENIMAQCGTPVDESEVPEDHPIRLRPLTLPTVSSKSTKKTERPTIKEYEEDVDLELDQDGSRTKRSKTEPLSSSSSSLEQQATTASILTPKGSMPATPSTPDSTVSAPTQPTTMIDKDNTQTTPINNITSTLSTTLPKEAGSSSNNIESHILQEQSSMETAKSTESSTLSSVIPEKNHITSPSPAPSMLPIETTATISTTDKSTSTIASPSTPGGSSAPLTPISENPEEGKTESLTSAIAEKGSRFYIKRRIVVGNVSKYIPPEKRDPTLKNYTHKWMIYVVEPPQDQDKKPFLTGVRYHLHPSYKPYDVVDVTESPFRLTRLGWGEFPIRLQLYFVDKRRNKSLDVIHHLRLDYTLSGRQMLGNERGFDIELDRNTNFEDVTTIPGLSSDTASTTNDTSSSTLAPSSSSSNNTDVTTTATPAILSKQNMMVNATKQRMTLLQGILKECVQLFPMVSRSQQQPSGSSRGSLRYTCANSTKHYFTWSAPRRKALEWHRSHLLRIEVQQRCKDINDDILRTACDALSTKDVIRWCREQGYTPNKKEDRTLDDNVEEEEERSKEDQGSDVQQWCRYCGSDQHLTLDCTRKPSGWRKKKQFVLGDQHTLSDVRLLLEQSGLSMMETEKKDMDDVVQVDDDMESDKTCNYQDLLNRIRDRMMDEEDNERSLDWIWSVIAPLRLKTMVANNISMSRQGQLQMRTGEEDLMTAMDQRLVVGQLFLQLTKLFLKKILTHGVAIWQKEKDQEKKNKLLVPYHIHQAIQQVDHFDFLTNAYMGTYKKQQQPLVTTRHPTTFSSSSSSSTDIINITKP
ncbi:uncharacterized protein BX664DRAFT_15336 [Halteromyces radiatus]|uniref:uncharacterized protein n=1 Tax=Halteromyces radiatus TaxID=101107 RepID=UPI00221E4B62|nr:uncharacterized protein BX664DRAFT_15336 [Halteromyces radiatus]KAI8099183.1 hypothetical protein BX664DRAFT_15336 [Halteromyces radiatus]